MDDEFMDCLRVVPDPYWEDALAIRLHAMRYESCKQKQGGVRSARVLWICGGVLLLATCTVCGYLGLSRLVQGVSVIESNEIPVPPAGAKASEACPSWTSFEIEEVSRLDLPVEIPTWLPEGYRLRLPVKVSKTGTYWCVSLVWDSDSEGASSIVVGAAHAAAPIVWEMKPGSFKEIQEGSHGGVIRRGAWVSQTDSNGVKGPIHWEDSGFISIFWREADVDYEMSVIDIPESALLRMWRSFGPIPDR